MQIESQYLADAIGQAVFYGMCVAVGAGLFTRSTVEFLSGLLYEYRANRRWRAMRRRKLLAAAQAHASGRTDLGSATGFDPRFLDAIECLDRRERISARRAQWEAEQASAGR